jgi:hypothetical protein
VCRVRSTVQPSQRVVASLLDLGGRVFIASFLAIFRNGLRLFLIVQGVYSFRYYFSRCVFSDLYCRGPEPTRGREFLIGEGMFRDGITSIHFFFTYLSDRWRKISRDCRMPLSYGENDPP